MFVAECSKCGSLEHASHQCPHGMFSSNKCSKCGSLDHASHQCPHGMFSSNKCSNCGSLDHASDKCPHGMLSSNKCSKCGSLDHASHQCPHGMFADECSKCGSRDHATAQCPHGAFKYRRESYESSPTVSSRSPSNEEALVKLIAGIVAVVAVVWFIFSVAVPLLIINVAVIALVAGLSQRSWQRVAFPVSVLGVAFLMLDINRGWATDTLVSNVSFFADWIPAFFYANTIAGLVAAYLLAVNILNTRQRVHVSAGELTKRNTLVMGGLLSVTAITVALQVATGFKPRAASHTDVSSLTSTTVVPQPPPPPLPPTDSRRVPSTDVSSSSWRISADAVFTPSGVASTALQELLSKLESPSEDGSPWSAEEFHDLLSRPEAHIVYADQVTKYATPLSISIQSKENEDYTKVFMKEKYQKAGLEFLKRHQATLDRVEKDYGVLRRDVLSVLIWESGLGEFTGDFQEFNVFLGQILYLDLAQDAAVQRLIAEGKSNPLDDPTRAEKERKRLDKRKGDAIKNLAALLRLCKQAGTDPLAMKGSWGGAIGYVQFMPVNLKYAVDGDSDGKVDLSTWPDAIMSVGRYLREVGNYDSTDEGRKRAILTYNPSNEYANGVMLVAETVWRRHLNGE